MVRFGIGQGVARFEDPRLLLGGGRYCDDVALPRMVFGHVLRSAHAHARLLSLDIEEAAASPGVLLVLTGADWESCGWGDLPLATGMRLQDGTPAPRPRYPALAKDRVRFVGDPIAFVVASSLAAAADAAEKIAVSYEPLAAITSTAEALREGAPQVWEECPNNIAFTHREGNEEAARAAFAKAAHIVEERFIINRVTAATMEPRAAVGDFDPASNLYTVYTPLQRAHAYRSELAKGVLRVPESRVRIIAGDIGGSFGMKSAVMNEVPLVLLASQRLKRPVKWTSTRSEAFLSDPQGRDNVTEAALGLDGEGRFLGLKVKTVANIGAYPQAGSNVFIGNLGTLCGVYRTPAAFVEVAGVYTHTNPVRPYRGNGRPEAAYVIERLVDIAARELQIDRIELRRRNMVAPSAMPFKTGLTFTYDCGEFEKTLDMALALADTAGFEARKALSQSRGRLRGLGLSYTIERAAANGFEAAEIRFDKSGTVTLLSGSISNGQGHETIYKQILAERLGVSPDEMRYIAGDTDKVALGEGTGGSRSAALGGSAFAVACDKVIAKGKSVAAAILGVERAEIAFAEGVFSALRKNRTLSIGEVAAASFDPKNLPEGMEPGLIAGAVFTAKVANYPNGCHICELEIDPETGQVFLDRYSVADDVGTVLNPLLLEGQIKGGIAQGAGQALMETIRFEPQTGQLQTGSFMDYAMPRAGDLPAIHCTDNPVPTRTNPLGVKGAGEAGNVGALPAVANALLDALSPFGIRQIEMPATAESIWRALRRRP